MGWIRQMKNKDFFKGKNVLIVGLGRSGLACANLFFDLGANVSVTERQNSEATRLNALKLKSKKIEVELGKHSQGFVSNKDLLIVSPGVTASALPVQWAQEYKILIVSEIEVAWFLCPATVIAVTGSNGKTTVTTLIGKILEAQGKNVFVCGNIGNPFALEVQKMREGDFVSLEVSSFQLETIQRFKPKISVILNISRNHLDRYGDIQEYIAAKKRIFLNQEKEDYLVLNYDDPILRSIAHEPKAKIVYFSQEDGLNPNQSAVLKVGSILNIDKELMLKVFKDFRGIEHRIEYVAEISDIRFINDSKATTVDSALWALKNIDSPVILIAGGRHKGLDYSLILKEAQKKVKSVILLGESKELIKEALGAVFPVDYAQTLEEAVKKAFLKASAGDSVLFSPMCSSFDMFSNYEERGNCFKKAVSDLARSYNL
jgi:UDP-N-acetylmuramoylalanine--D-glutamate ligase